MLELRPNCERCDRDLPPDADARICSYECTFCVECAEEALANVCPNCGGGFVRGRSGPRGEWRDGTGLEHDPPGTRRRQLKLHRRRRSTSWCRGCAPSIRATARPPPPARPRAPPDRLDARIHVGLAVVDQFETEIRSSRSPRHVVAPSQHVPSSCTRRSTPIRERPRRRPARAPGSARRRSPPRTRRARRGASANRRASPQQRSTRSATPDRPSDRSAAHVANPRARRDDSSVKSPPPKARPSTWPERYEAMYAIALDVHLADARRTRSPES